jgi:hypothetical protein
MLDVFCLRAFVVSSEKNNKHVALAYEIDPVARAITNPKLRDTFSDWTDITWISQGQTFDTNVDTGFCCSIMQPTEPCGLGRGLPNLQHATIVSPGIRGVTGLRSVYFLAGFA